MEFVDIEIPSRRVTMLLPSSRTVFEWSTPTWAAPGLRRRMTMRLRSGVLREQVEGMSP